MFYFVQSKTLLQGVYVLIFLYQLRLGFCKLFNVYFNDVQLKGWLHVLSSTWENPLGLGLAQKKKTETFSFTSTNNQIILAVKWSVK